MDGFSQYIQDILRYPLLSKQQEIMLARQVQDWVNSESPTFRQEKIGQRAYHKLINCNLRLVVSIAKRYTPHARRTELFDIVQEGNMGLAHGIKKFDPERGYALSTYVYWWIRQSITRYLSCNDRMIRLPSHAVELLSKIRKWRPEFYRAHGRYPTLEELADYCKVRSELLSEYLEKSEDALSLDRVVNNTENDITLLDGITDGEHPMDNIEFLMTAEEVTDLMARLEDTDAKIIYGIFGLDGQEPKTYTAIGKELGISRERARQRCMRALNKMKLMATRNRAGVMFDV